MSKNTINIDGDKLKTLLEDKTNKTIRDISIENGFSKNLISEAIRTGKASPIVQSIARLYGIVPEMYRAIPPELTPDPAQISIDDINSINRDELKKLIKEAVTEVLSNTPNIIVKGIDYDPNYRRFKLVVYEEDLK